MMDETRIYDGDEIKNALIGQTIRGSRNIRRKRI